VYAWYGRYTAVMGKTRTRNVKPSIFGHQYKSRDARSQFSTVMDTAVRGDVAVVQREKPVVIVRRDLYNAALESSAPFEVKGSVHEGQFSFWLEGVPVQGGGATLEDAEDDFLDALVDYAELWTRELRHAPNHKQNGVLVQRIAMYAESRDDLREVVFGAD
jgi:hypothetical protein